MNLSVWYLAWCFVVFRNILCSRDITKHANWNLLDHDNCGSGFSDRIIGGTKASLGQFPWMVRLGYAFATNEAFVFFKCGGSLINKMYVVSAAHCFADEDNFLVILRLGEHYTKTKIDCEGDRCAPPVQDIPPERIMIHRDYHQPAKFRNDVALIRLKKPATLSEYVRPICIPYGSLMQKDHLNTTMEVAGWGLIDSNLQQSSPTLLFVRITVVPIEKCQKAFEGRTLIFEGQLCVGGAKGYDSCGGDSGGPLMKVEVLDGPPRYFLLGLVSFGATQCGGTDPAVYTDVSKYTPWLLDNMTP